MMRSMTGYGRYEWARDEMKVTVEMRSVNHRYCDITMHMPRALISLEEAFKRVIKKNIQRGKVDVWITLHSDQLNKKNVSIDWEFAKKYLHAVKQMNQSLGIRGELNAQDLLSIPDLFQIEEEEPDLTDQNELLLTCVEKATQELAAMRAKEGQTLAEDLALRLGGIQSIIEYMTEHAPIVITDYRRKLEERMGDYLDSRFEIDEARLLNEVAVFADKADIDEELTRLQSHCTQFMDILTKEYPVGRKMDFLIQEMNREINTIGSKSNDIGITQQVVEVKSLLDKIKEQAQNIE